MAQTPVKNKNIFVSYSRQHSGICESLVKNLNKAGYNLWYDEHIPGGQAWWRRICEEIEKCQIFIQLLEPSILDSVYCEAEIAYAVSCKREVLPVKIEQFGMSKLPPMLARLQTVALTDMPVWINGWTLSPLLMLSVW